MSETNNLPALNILDVHKQYGELAALKGVNLQVPQGCFFGLLGPNGAGKSTLINIMAGLIQATRGRVEVLGHDTRRDWRKARQTLGVVPQELVYDPFFSVREILRLQSGYFGLGPENHAWIEELLDTLNLRDKANTSMQKLSGGMKRRVLIAQALVHRPRVVVLDEPTAGVDVELRQVLWEFSQQLHRQGHTILLTTHYLEEAEALCQQIAILHHGQLVALDSKQGLLARHPYRFLCLDLLDSAIQLPEALQEKVVSFEDRRLKLRLHRQHDPVGSVLDSLLSAGIRFHDLHTHDPSLEDVFMALTRRRDAPHQETDSP